MILRKIILAIFLTIPATITTEKVLGNKDGPTKMPRHGSNKVTDIDTTCNKEAFEIQVKMEKPFKGIIFTKDFSRECRSQGSMKKLLTLNLPPNACGVRTSSSLRNDTLIQAEDEGLLYSVTVVVQMDKYLQQSSDQEIIVKCWLQPQTMRIHSTAVENMLEIKIKDMTKSESKKIRTGRNRQDAQEHLTPEQRSWLLEQARAWMELTPALNSEKDIGDDADSIVQVGQPTALVIKSTLPAGIGVRITDCLAHDGLGEASQKLLDEYGCPIDELIFTKPALFKHKPISEINVKDLESVDVEKNEDVFLQKSDEPEKLYKNIMVYQHAKTTFGAFKFPDRARLHLTCGVELCKGECPPIDCIMLDKPMKVKDGLVRKTRLDKNAYGVVLDRIEVYNSIEVLAPNIELEDEASIRGSRHHILGEDDITDFSRSFSPGDKTVCMSPSKMALAFCILGLIFLCALAVALVSLLRAKKKYSHQRFHSPLSFYTGSKSLFSGSTSSSSGLSGSKLLLTDSPYLDHNSSTSNNWPYARAY